MAGYVEFGMLYDHYIILILEISQGGETGRTRTAKV